MVMATDDDRPSLSLLKNEAVSYLRLGLLTPSWRKVPTRGGSAELGVVFVPGVGANGSQFLGLKRSLEDRIGWFDAFEYSSFWDIKKTANKLKAHLHGTSRACSRIVVVGHSLGGFLLQVALSAEDAPKHVAGFAAICAPLHGTWRARLSPSPSLRALAPDGALLAEVGRSRHRLDRFRGRLLTIGAKHDQFLDPSSSAFLDGSTQVQLDDVAHAGSLFDDRVHRAVSALIDEVGADDTRPA
jgi:pimeloyl-ACP methyl ester carboxylesterase